MLTIQNVNAQDPSWSNIYNIGGEYDAVFKATDTTDDGNFIALGNLNNGDRSSIILAKINHDGDTLWTRVVYNSELPFSAEGKAIKCCSDGTFIIAGTIYPDPENADLYLVKVNAEGELLWGYNYGGNQLEEGYAVVQSGDDFVACGYTNTGSVEGSSDAYVVKVDEDGGVIWEDNYGTSNDETAYSLCIRSGGDNGVGYYIAGCLNIISEDIDSIYTLYIDNDGDVIKQKNYGIGYSSSGNSVIHSKAGGFIIGGKTKAGEDDDYDFAVIKINDNDSLLFTNSTGGEEDDIAYSIMEHNDGSLFLSGTTKSFADPDYGDIYIVRTDNWGDTLHTWLLDSGNIDAAYGCVLDYDSNLVVVGSSYIEGKNVQWADFINTKCGHWYKRTLWINNLWCLSDCSTSQTTCFTNDILNSATTPTTATQIQSIVDYLNTMKIRKVVITKAWDFMCEDLTFTFTSPWPYNGTGTTYSSQFSNNSNPVTGSSMRTALASFIQNIKTNAHVEKVYIQLRSEPDEGAFELGNPNYTYADPLKNNYWMLEGIKAYNSAQPTQATRVDGILIDYEYGSPVYGWDNNSTPTNCQKFQYIRPGWEAFKRLLADCGSLVNHGDNIYGLEELGIYFTGFNLRYLSYIPSTACSTAFVAPIHDADVLIPDQDQADFIEDPANNLDFIECEMFLQDDTQNGSGYNWSTSNPDRPDKWYYGGASASYFYNQLYFLGNNNYQIPIIPALDFSSNAPRAHLGNYAMGLDQWNISNTNCPNPGPHYIPDIENDFYYQFWSWFQNFATDLSITNPFSGNTLACREPIPLGGIDLFRSELDPLNMCYLIGNSRNQDALPNYPVFGRDCPVPADEHDERVIGHNLPPSDLAVFPIPFEDEITIHSYNNSAIKNISILNVTGIVLQTFEVNSKRSEVLINNLGTFASGVYLIRIQTETGVSYCKIIKL